VPQKDLYVIGNCVDHPVILIFLIMLIVNIIYLMLFILLGSHSNSPASGGLEHYVANYRPSHNSMM
jgi:hypothetical protein